MIRNERRRKTNRIEFIAECKCVKVHEIVCEKRKILNNFKNCRIHIDQNGFIESIQLLFFFFVSLVYAIFSMRVVTCQEFACVCKSNEISSEKKLVCVHFFYCQIKKEWWKKTNRLVKLNKMANVRLISIKSEEKK